MCYRRLLGTRPLAVQTGWRMPSCRRGTDKADFVWIPQCPLAPVPRHDDTGAIAVPNRGLQCHCGAKAVPLQCQRVSWHLRDAPMAQFSAVPACPACPNWRETAGLGWPVQSRYSTPPFFFSKHRLCWNEARWRPPADSTHLGLILKAFCVCCRAVMYPVHPDALGPFCPQTTRKSLSWASLSLLFPHSSPARVDVRSS